MKRTLVLVRTECDVRKLPLEAREAFVLSQLDGLLTVEEIGEMTSTSLSEVTAIASRLVEVGAATAKGPTSVRVPRFDPRVDPDTIPPRFSTKPPRRSVRPKSGGPKAEEPKRPRSRKSLAKMPAAETCELDERVRGDLIVLGAKVGIVDHYEKLGIGRGADKKEIKRAYFAYVARFHPDRFFGKKTGSLKKTLDEVFVAMTEAHDTLVDPTRRATYDATLPAASVVIAPAPAIDGVRTGRRSSRAMKAVAPKAPIPAVVVPKPVRKQSSRSIPASKPVAVPSVPPATADTTGRRPKLTDERLRELVTMARETRPLARREMLVRGGEEALAAGDTITAANNFRLALEHADDPYLRLRLADLDVLAKQVTIDRTLTRARGAEKEGKWEAAAIHYQRAYEVRRDPAVAERAAHALHMSRGDLEKASALALAAVSMRPKNAEYRVTHAEILLARKETTQAKEEAETALALAPKDSPTRSAAQVVLAGAKK